MFQPTQFMDGENIVVVDNVPYYCYTGVTYLERLKNGLSLDYVFQQQDLVPVFEDENDINEEQKTENLSKLLDIFDDYEENFEFYEQKEFETISPAKNSKWPGFKKRQSRNQKKNPTRINGYNDKLFAIEQELADLFDESQIDIDYDDISVISYESRYRNIYLRYYDDYDNDYDNWSYN